MKGVKQLLIFLVLGFAIVSCGEEKGFDGSSEKEGKNLTPQEESYYEIKGQLRATRGKLENLLQFQDVTKEQQRQLKMFYDDIENLTLEEITAKYEVPEDKTDEWLDMVKESLKLPEEEEPLLINEGVVEEDTL